MAVILDAFDPIVLDRVSMIRIRSDDSKGVECVMGLYQHRGKKFVSFQRIAEPAD